MTTCRRLSRTRRARTRTLGIACTAAFAILASTAVAGVVLDRDGWTVRARPNAEAHEEHTIMIATGGPVGPNRRQLTSKARAPDVLADGPQNGDRIAWPPGQLCPASPVAVGEHCRSKPSVLLLGR